MNEHFDGPDDASGAETHDNVGATVDASFETPHPLAESTLRISRGTAATAGLLAAGVALGVGELLSGVSNKIPSLIVRVGDVVINNAPGAVERWAIDTLGTGDKPALIIGISAISLLLGAIAGVAANRKFAVGAGFFVLFGVLGGWAAALDPQRPAGWGWFSAILAATAGVATLWALLSTARSLSTSEASLGATRTSRRTFVGAATAAAAVGVAAPVIGGALRSRQSAQVEGDRDVVAAALDSIDEPTAVPDVAASEVPTSAMPVMESFDDIDGISTLISPNDNFYRIDSALSIPRIDVDTWSMKITGMVDQELEFTFADLLDMDPVEEFVTLSCVSNPVGGNLVGNARWLGVPIKKLLDMAGVQPGATQIVGRSVDGWTGGFPTEYLDAPDRTALVAVAMNGEPLPTQHGFPVRLVVAGLYGYVSATKWLKEIELTTWDAFDGYWITRGWSKLGPIKTQSRIDVPNANARLAGGQQPIAGVAWAPDRGVDKVEVLITDIVDGEEVPSDNWIEAELSDDVTDNSWRQWMLPWDAPTGDHVLRVRATDGEGVTQTSERTRVDPDGASGWHTIAVRVT